MWDDDGIFIIQVIIFNKWHFFLQNKKKMYWDNFSRKPFNKLTKSSYKIIVRSVHWVGKCDAKLKWDHTDNHII